MKVTIIGGGISGLSAAYFLEKSQAKKEGKISWSLLESSPHLGGVIQTETKDDFLIERGPDAFLSVKANILSFIRELGLESKLKETNADHRRSFIAKGRHLIPVPDGLYLMAPKNMASFLASPLLSPLGKIRVMAELILPKGKQQEDESVASFVRRRLGQEALDRIAQPMIGGIYTADPNLLSLRSTMPMFLDWEAKYGSVIRALRSTQSSHPNKGTSGPRYSLFLSFQGGMQTLPQQIEAHLPASQVHKGEKILNLQRSGRRWILLTASQKFESDLVFLAIGPKKAASLLPPDLSIGSLLKKIPFASTGTLNLAFRREQIRHPLDGMGFVVPHIENKSLVGCSFSSTKFPGRAPNGNVLLRVFYGGALRPDLMDLEENELIEKVLADLNEWLGIHGKPIFSVNQRWMESMPQYHLGHSRLIQEIEKARQEESPNLHFLGSGYDSVGIPDLIEASRRKVEKIFPSSENPHPD